MPILPLMDLLILMGWTSLLVAFVQKAIWISTSYRPSLFGMSPLDFVMAGGICLVFAIALAARTWVKMNEQRLVAAQRVARQSASEREAEAAARAAEDEELAAAVTALQSSPRTASADHG